MTQVAALVLAAGAGRRFAAAGGVGQKLLATVDGRPLLSSVLDVAMTAGLDPVLIVVPPDNDELIALAETHPAIRIVVNPDAAVGMATSVAAGLEALASTVDMAGTVGACVVLLGDQPGIDPDVIEAVVGASQRSGRPARARYSDGVGHPVVLPRASWSGLVAGLPSTGSPERGAQGLLTGLGVIEVDVIRPMPLDIDVPEDIHRAGDVA